VTEPSTQPAGVFSAWLGEIGLAIRGQADATVPCGSCTACCRSSQFVHVGPDEVDALAHIPRALLFPAPRMPKGHVLMGFNERGECPMLIDDRCSIYEHRPRTCRTYDCRVFLASGLDAADDGKEAIAAQARRWVFEYPREHDRMLHEAVCAAAVSLAVSDDAPTSATRLAVAAVERHAEFLNG
jgi:uncharacterized protein